MSLGLPQDRDGLAGLREGRGPGQIVRNPLPVFRADSFADIFNLGHSQNAAQFQAFNHPRPIRPTLDHQTPSHRQGPESRQSFGLPGIPGENPGVIVAGLVGSAAARICPREARASWLVESTANVRFTSSRASVRRRYRSEPGFTDQRARIFPLRASTSLNPLASASAVRPSQVPMTPIQY